MADGIKGAMNQAAQDLGEAVVKPVTDEVGKALEQGVQTVVQGPKQLTAQQLQQKPFDTQGKQAEDAAKMTEARRKISWWKNLQEAQSKVRAEQRQKVMQKQQEESQKKQIKQFEIVQKKKENATLIRAQRKTEIRGGVGG